MRHVICSLPNASENISGVKFVRQADGSVMTAEPMEDAAAQEAFGSIPGYTLVDPDAKPAPSKGKRPSAEELAAKAAAEASAVAQPAPAPVADAPAAEAPATA